MRKMFSVGVAGLMACASLVFTTGCNDNDDHAIQPTPVSYVTLYNASPDAPDLGILVDGRQINFHPFEYSDNTGYLRFYTGERKLEFGPYGASNVVVDTTLTLENEKAYSIFVADEFSKVSVLVLNDNSAPPGSGKAKIRFVNLSPDAESVQLKVKGDSSQLVGAQGFKHASDFLEVDGKQYDFEVTSGSGDAVDLNIPDVNIQPGLFYTILVRGYKTPPSGNTNVLSAEVILN